MSWKENMGSMEKLALSNQHNAFLFFLGQKSCPGSLNFIHPNLMLLHFMLSIASTFLTAADDLCLDSAVL